MLLIYGLLALLIALNIADIVTTLAVLRKGGTESNPIARSLFGRIGVLPGAILLKGGLVALVIVLVVYYPQYWFILVVLCAFSLFAIVNNRGALDD